MRESWEWLGVVGWMVGIAACGAAPPPVTGDDDAGVDGPRTDGPGGDTQTPPAASCVGLPVTCGAGGDDHCCTSPEVAGGSYYRSFDVAADPSSGNMNSPATLGSFRLDKYEVTV